MADTKDYEADVINDLGNQLCTCTIFVGRSKEFLAKDCVCCVEDEIIKRRFMDTLIDDFHNKGGQSFIVSRHNSHHAKQRKRDENGRFKTA